MVLLRAPLGRRGSYLATALNVLQNLGWTVFELIVIATVAAALSERLFGFHGEWLWKLVAAAATTALALLGPVGFVRRWVRRFAIWVVLASLAYLSWWALHDAGLHALWNRPGKGGLGFWGGVDLMIAMPASWLPLAADYTRFSRSRGRAFWGTGFGYLLPNVWLYSLGAVLLLSRNLSDATSLMTAIAGGGIASVLALLALGVDETKEPFANVYSTAVSLQNLLPRVSQRLLIVVAAAISTAGAFSIDLTQYPTFLYLLGSFFVPLFGVLAADWLIRRGYDRDAVFAAPALRPALLGAWLAGFALYQWLLPTGPSWWTGLIAHLHPQNLGFGASLPAFALAFALDRAGRARSRGSRVPRSSVACEPDCLRRYSQPVRPIGIVGSLSHDSSPGREPRAGGCPYYAARALRLLERPSRIVSKCGEEHRRLLLGPLLAQGVPVSWRSGKASTGFELIDDGDSRKMKVTSIGDSWTAEEARGWIREALGPCEWVHVAPLLRGEFCAATLAEIARDRIISLDGQGLARSAGARPARSRRRVRPRAAPPRHRAQACRGRSESAYRRGQRRQPGRAGSARSGGDTRIAGRARLLPGRAGGGARPARGDEHRNDRRRRRVRRHLHRRQGARSLAGRRGPPGCGFRRRPAQPALARRLTSEMSARRVPERDGVHERCARRKPYLKIPRISV